MSGIVTPSYRAGFYAPQRGGRAKYPQLWRGCVGAWCPSLGQTGLVLRDQSLCGSHGTLTNMDPATDWIVSQGQQVLDFDGSNDTVVTPLTVGGFDAITFMVWCQTAAPAGAYHYCGCWNTVGQRVAAIYSGVMEVSPNGLQTGVYGTINASAIPANKMNCLVGTWKANSKVKMYCNGSLISTSSSAPPSAYNVGTQFTIGRMASNNLPFLGQIGMVAAWNRELTASEAAVLARSQSVMFERVRRRAYPSAGGGSNRRRRMLICGAM